MLNKNSNINKNICGLLGSFFIPAIIITAVYILLDVFPGGRFTPLILDLGSEQFPFYNYLNSANGISGLFYQNLGGLGGGVINSLQMCTGPFVFVFSQVPALYIPYAIWGMIIFLVGLSGLAEYIYLKNGYPGLQGVLKPLLLSVCYSLMSCSVVYTIVPAWLWGILLLPFVSYGLDKLVDDGKSGRFILFLSLSIIFNYLTAYIIIIFSFIYLLFRMYIKGMTAKDHLSLFLKYFISGVTAVAVTAVSWLPVLCDLIIGKAEENRHPVLGFTRNPLAVIVQLFIPRYDGLGRYSLPYVFCGLVPFILMMFFFLNRKIDFRKKIAGMTVICFFVLSFSIGLLDISWMFFSEPNGYPARYSFVLSFFMILLASLELKETEHPVLLKPVVTVLAFVFVLFECFADSFSLITKIRDDVGPYSEYAEYVKAYSAMEEIITGYDIESGTERTVKNWRLTNDDGILFGYSDIDYFSSSYNSGFHDFMRSLGFNTQYHILRSEGITPVVASVLGVSHFIEFNNDLSAYYNHVGTAGELDIYENSLSLPIVFAIESDDPNLEPFHSNDPFRNINDLLYDLSGVDGVYDEMDHSVEDGCATVFVDDGRDLWMYARSDAPGGRDIHSPDNDEIQYVYYDGMPVRSYANDVSSYCVCLGFGGGDNASFTFDGMPSDISFASLNVPHTLEALSVLRDNVAYDFADNGSGFGCSMDLDETKYVLLTLPFDKGFTIRDNGKPIDYYAYAGALICFELDEGSHRIEVDYLPYGLITGLIISLTGAVIIALMLCAANHGDNKRR